ncbi:hypothetical protein PWT90_07810 [Aphanocladium album]|nr:hypothetical protein PWT90_07810 [Aphanocladium album]
MGVRSLTVVIYENRRRICQVAQHDGCPSCIGLKICKIVTTHGLLEKFAHGLAFTYEITEADANERVERLVEDERPEKSDLEKSFRSFTKRPTEVEPKNEFETIHGSLKLETGAAVIVLVAHATADNPLPLYDAFAERETCNWAYVINLDNREIEVFGSRDKTTQPNRFDISCKKGSKSSDHCDDEDFEHGADGSYTSGMELAFIGHFSFDKLGLTDADHKEWANKLEIAQQDIWDEDDQKNRNSMGAESQQDEQDE